MLTDPLIEFQQAHLYRMWGKYAGKVVSNDDSEQMGRLQVTCGAVLGDENVWALPCVPYAGPGVGFYFIPPVDAGVWIEFEGGDVSRPIWTGTFWQQAADVPAEAALTPPTTRLLKTPSGHLFQIDDKEGEERLFLHHVAGTELEIDKDGNVLLTDAGGAKVTLDAKGGKLLVEDANGNKLTMEAAGTTVEDANGNKIEMAAAGVTVSGQKVVIKGQQVALAGDGGEPILKGQSFLTLFATHIHPTAMGPSGPPVPQGEMSTLSTKVLTS